MFDGKRTLTVNSDKLLEEILTDNIYRQCSIQKINLCGVRVWLPKELEHYKYLETLNITGCYRAPDFSTISVNLKTLILSTTSFKPNKTMGHLVNLSSLQYNINRKNMSILYTLTNPPIPNHPLLTTVKFNFGPDLGKSFSLNLDNALFGNIKNRIKCIDFSSKPYQVSISLSPLPLDKNTISLLSFEIREKTCFFIWFLDQSSSHFPNPIKYYLPVTFALAKIFPLIV